jgi:hypothetical protein
MPNVIVSLEWSSLYVTLLAARILKWLLGFENYVYPCIRHHSVTQLRRLFLPIRQLSIKTPGHASQNSYVRPDYSVVHRHSRNRGHSHIRVRTHNLCGWAFQCGLMLGWVVAEEGRNRAQAQNSLSPLLSLSHTLELSQPAQISNSTSTSCVMWPQGWRNFLLPDEWYQLNAHNYSHISITCFGIQTTAPSGPGPHYRGFAITLRHTTFGRTPLDEWSARRRDVYLTTHNTDKRHPWPPRDSNPQSQQPNGRRPTP